MRRDQRRTRELDAGDHGYEERPIRSDDRTDYYMRDDAMRRRDYADDRNWRDDERAVSHRAREYAVDDDERMWRERESRTRFNEALEEARRSQQEGMRRYREERERDDQRRFRAERGGPRRSSEERLAYDDYTGPADERRRYEQRMSELRPHRRYDYDEDDRYASTPRETLRERAEETRRRRLHDDERLPDRGFDRGRDDDYSRQAFRRGVDKLLDEPPSGRWRR